MCQLKWVRRTVELTSGPKQASAHEPVCLRERPQPSSRAPASVKVPFILGTGCPCLVRTGCQYLLSWDSLSQSNTSPQLPNSEKHHRGPGPFPPRRSHAPYADRPACTVVTRCLGKAAALVESQKVVSCLSAPARTGHWPTSQKARAGSRKPSWFCSGRTERLSEGCLLFCPFSEVVRKTMRRGFKVTFCPRCSRNSYEIIWCKVLIIAAFGLPGICLGFQNCTVTHTFSVPRLV